MDIVPLAGMLFSLLVVLIIAGSILMFPVMRRVGRLLETRLEERRGEVGEPEDVRSLREMVEGLQEEVRLLAERQQFTERLLESGRRRSPEESGPPDREAR